MKKSDLIDRLAAFTQSTKKDAGQMLAALKQIAEIEIACGRPFEIHGIIALSVQTRAARKARNPATGAAIDVPAKRVIKPRVPASLASMAG